MASPLLDLYLWMLGKLEISVIYLNAKLTSVTEDSLNNEIKLVENYLTRVARFKKFATFPPSSTLWGDSPETLHALSDPATCQDFLKFLYHFTKACHGDTQFNRDNIYKLAFTYLASTSLSPYLKNTRGQALFSSFLATNAEKAVDWYETHQEFSKALFPGIFFLARAHKNEQQTKNISQEVTEKKTYIQNLLQFESHVAGILPLFQKAVADVLEFSALLITALEQGVTSEQVVDSNILNQFIAFHFPHSSHENNEIKQLGEILQGFHASALAEKLRELYTHYSPALRDNQNETRSISYTHSEENFSNLAALFGELFLTQVCSQVPQTLHPKQSQWLAGHLNSMPSADLACFINQAGKNNLVNILKVLAQLLAVTTLKKLLSHHEGAVFYLADYRPEILEAVSDTKSLRNYLNLLKKQQSNSYDLIRQLVNLLKIVKNENATSKGIVFEEIVNLLLESLSLAQDVRLMTLIKREALSNGNVKASLMAMEAKKLLQEKITVLLKEWNTALSELMREKDYLAMEDLWIKYKNFFSVLMELNSSTIFTGFDLETNFPNNKYQLYAFLVKTLASGADFQLSAFLDAINLAGDQIDQAQVRERALIAILTAVDNELIRHTAIGLLNSMLRNSSWTKQLYGEDSVLSLAVQHENLGLIQFFHSPTTAEIYDFEPAVMERTLEAAANAGKWEMVKLLCDINANNKAGAAPTDYLLSIAARQGQLEIVQFLLDPCRINLLNPTLLSEALEIAAKRGNLALVRLLCNSCRSNLLNKTAIKAALAIAVSLKRVEIIEFICTLATENRPDTTVIGELLKKAALSGNWLIVQLLSNLTADNKPDNAAISFAFTKALEANQWHIVQSLANLAGNKLDQKLIEEALILAINKIEFNIIKFLCLDSPNKPSSQAIEKALAIALKEKKWFIVNFFCSLSSPIKPVAAVIKNCLQLAAEKGELAVLQLICGLSGDNKPTLADINEAKQLAEENQQAQVMEFLDILTILLPYVASMSIILSLFDLARQDKLGLSTAGLSSTLKACKESKSITNLLGNLLKVKELYDSIDELKERGSYLKKAKANVGTYAIEQAEALTLFTLKFVKLQSGNPAASDLAAIRVNFKAAWERSYLRLIKYGKLWKPILANIAVAATDMGLFIPATYFAFGKGFFAEGTRLTQIQAVEAVFDKVDKLASQ